MTTVEALKELYVAEGGTLANVADCTTIAEILEKLAVLIGG